jgi:hypothetical protein
MDGKRFGRVAPTGGNDTRRSWAPATLFGAALASLRALPLAAQNVASAGNGGYATASGNGGAVVIGDVNSGGNAGNAVGVGDTYGSVWVDGGDVSNSTSIGVSAGGGTAIADASGGSYNAAFVS